MSFFIDTNIAIGFTVIHDKWHEQSKKFINNCSDSIYWSNLVKDEYTRKLTDIEEPTEFFLKRVKLILKNNQKDFINYYEFEKYILNKTKICILDDFKKQKILEKFWEKYNFNEGISEVIKLKFNDFADEIGKIYVTRSKKLDSHMNFHNCGLDNYLRYMTYVNKLSEWGVHSPDNKIIADAHDCGSFHDNLIFVSTDDALIKILVNNNTSFLNIIEFKTCN